MKRNMSGTRIDHRSGSEGPDYDPYHYDEWSVQRRGHCYKLRIGGLSCCLTIDGVETDVHDFELPWPPSRPGRDYEDRVKWLVGCFERRVGMDLGTLNRIYYQHVYFEDPMGCLADYK